MRVPEYQQSVSQQGLPDARQTTHYTADDFMGGTQKAALGYGVELAGNLANDAQKVAVKHYEDQLKQSIADQARDAITQYRNTKQGAMFGVEGQNGQPRTPGFLELTGKNALAPVNGRSPASALQDTFQQERSSIAVSLTSDEAKAIFSQHADEEDYHTNGLIQQHEGQQSRVFRESTLKADNVSLEREIEQLNNDPVRIKANYEKLKGNHAQLAMLNGFNEEAGLEPARMQFSKALKVANASAIQNGGWEVSANNIKIFKDELDVDSLTDLKKSQLDAYVPSVLQSNPQALLDAATEKLGPQSFPAMDFERLKQIRDTVESHGADYNPDGSPVTHIDKDGVKSKYKNQVRETVAKDPGFNIRPAANDSPEEYNRVGDELLKAHYDYHKGDVEKTLAAYNGGRAGVDKAIKAGGDWQSKAGVKDYLDKAKIAANKTNTPLDDASPLELQQIKNQAESTLEKGRSVFQIGLKKQWENQYSQTATTGQSGEIIPFKTFQQAYGEKAGEEYANYQDQLNHANNAYSIKDMPTADVNKLLEATKPTADLGYGFRPDGTAKGEGYLGVLKRPDGGVMTEYSVGVNINGKEMDIPSIVPTLNKDEVNQILNLKDGELPSDAIIAKATSFAEDRIAKGLPVFHDTPTGNFASEQKQYDDLKSAADHIQTERMKDPIAYAYQSGYPVQPINWTNPQQAATELQSRMAVSDQLMDKFGTKPTVLTTEEAKSLSTTFEAMPTKDALKLMDSLSKSTNPISYNMAMQQLRKDSPVTAMAGALYGVDKAYQQSNWGGYADPTTININGQKAAEYVLKGERLLNPTTGDKSEDGKSKNIFMPKDTEFQTAFDEATNGAFANHPDAANTTMQTVRSAYAGISSETGDTHKEFNSDTFDKALEMVTGTKGGALNVFNNRIIPPYGMPEDVFTDKVTQQFNQQMDTAGLHRFVTNDNINHYKIIPMGDGLYGFTDGNTIKPIVINLNLKSDPIAQAINP